LAGIVLAPSGKPATNSKPLDLFFFGSNLFLGDGRLNESSERQRVKAIHIWRYTVTGDGSKSGKSDHFHKGCATRLCVLRRGCSTANGEMDTANREIDQDDLT
jgi:hypothetical protein